jgi:hypothetical protein
MQRHCDAWLAAALSDERLTPADISGSTIHAARGLGVNLGFDVLIVVVELRFAILPTLYTPVYCDDRVAGDPARCDLRDVPPLSYPPPI